MAAPLNRIMNEADGPMVIAELEEQLPGTLDRWGASDQIKQQVREELDRKR